MALTQKQRILIRLQAGDVLTRRYMIDEMGILEGPARICELRKEGHLIDTETVKVGKARIAKWSLVINRQGSLL